MTSGQGAAAGPEDLVSEAHLEARLFRSLTQVEKDARPFLLQDAWEEIRGRVPTLDARREAGLISDGQLRKVLTAMVTRVLGNPNAIRQYSVDDGTIVRDAAVSGGLLYVTESDVALLSGLFPGGAEQHISFSVPYR